MHITYSRKLSIKPYSEIDYLVPIFFIVFLISAIINQNESTQNYLIAYFFVFFVLYLFLKSALYSCSTSRQIYIANAWGIVFVGIFLSVNFILTTTGIINLQDMMPRIKDASATYNQTLIRGYGFSTEPGVVAFYLNTLGPIALWFIWSETKLPTIIKSLLVSFVFLGWLVTFSAAGFIFLLLSVIVTLVVLKIWANRAVIKKTSRKIKVSIALSAFSLIVLISWASAQPIVQNFLYPIFLKLSLSENSSSAGHRVQRWSESLSMLFDKPFFGYGPRYFSAEGQSSALNWFLMLIIEGGFISFFIMSLFLFLVMVRMLKWAHPARTPFLIGFFAGCAHLTITSVFFHPFLWLLIAIFFVQRAKVNAQNILQRPQTSRAENIPKALWQY